MGKIMRGMVAVAFSLVFLVVPAHAYMETITISGCASCFGSIYNLTVSDGYNDGLYHAVLSVDATHFKAPTGKDAAFISAVDFKVSSKVSSDATNLQLISAPGAESLWSTYQKGISNSGCSSGGSGFVCSQDLGPEVNLAPVGSVHTWEWAFGLASSTLFPDLLGAHIGAKYNNASVTLNGVITSEEAAAPVPEPGTLLLLGSGLVGLAGIAWKRNRRE